ncbi:MAG: tetratricopeptide repeat protein, partial [Deltaproteobacteria bacterium]|nr:tetratricopeptide repeat protein [Deltaproteobacteria bacterium]
MKAKILVAAFAVAFLIARDAGAFHGNSKAASARLQGRAYSQFLSGYLHYREGDLDAALESYREALRYQENEPEILFEVANVLVKKGKLSEARQYLEQALVIDQDHARSLYLLAGILAATGDREKAISLYSRAVSDNPDIEEAYVHLSTLYAEKGDFGKAEEYLNTLIKRNPESFLAYYYRGRILAAQDKFDAALSDFDRSLSIYPAFEGALIDSGGILELMGRHAEAEERYRKALALNPGNPAVRERLGR